MGGITENVRRRSVQHMIRGIRVELKKPLNCTWDELGDVLRKQRAMMHRLLNAAVIRCVIAHRQKEDGAIQTLAYQEVAEEIARIRDWARGHKDPKVCERFSEFDLPGGTKASISSVAYAAFQKWNKGAGAERLTTWKRGAPILLRAQEWGISKTEGGYELSLKLTAGRTGKMRVGVAGSNGKHWRWLGDLTSGSSERGDCKILYDEEKKKWYAILASKEADAAPMTADPARALVIHRGVHNWLYMTSTTGQSVAMRGNKFSAQKRALEARMRDFRNVSQAERGSGAKGHGRRRRYESYDALDNKLKAVIHTLCQQSAARVVELAKQWGCGLVIIEDYGGIGPDEDRALRRFVPRFPLYQLKQAIAWACKREGLQLSEHPAEYVSTTCPCCGDMDARYHNNRTGIFHCSACGFERPADWVASLNFLRRSGVVSSVWDQRLQASQELAQNMRSSK
jgi:transposase